MKFLPSFLLPASFSFSGRRNRQTRKEGGRKKASNRNCMADCVNRCFLGLSLSLSAHVVCMRKKGPVSIGLWVVGCPVLSSFCLFALHNYSQTLNGLLTFWCCVYFLRPLMLRLGCAFLSASLSLSVFVFVPRLDLSVFLSALFVCLFAS